MTQLVQFMMSGPVLIMVLEGDDAIAKNRERMAPPTRRTPPRAPFAALLGLDRRKHVHGSDGPETPKTEIAWLFADNKLFSR